MSATGHNLVALDRGCRRVDQLPREALPDPVDGTPLALHRLVTLYRKASAAAPVRPLPGPLRIVVAIKAAHGLSLIHI